MNQPTTERMLLAHNFNLPQKQLPPLNREEFAQIFIDGLKFQDDINCSLINNSHWVVEILFPINDFMPKEIGAICGQILLNKRQKQKSSDQIMPDILILGGKKTSPPRSISPASLQPGEWGVDVIETDSAKTFLTAIEWELKTSKRPVENIFKVELLRSKSLN